jgi:AbrB family looped-hinge helix DNA binding protein
MLIVRLSSKGQFVIPKEIRAARHWRAGTEFEVIQSPDGLLLRPLPQFAPSTLDDLIGSANYGGPALTLEDMEAAIATGIERDRY